MPRKTKSPTPTNVPQPFLASRVAPRDRHAQGQADAGAEGGGQMSTLLISEPAQFDASGKLIKHGLRVTMSKGTAAQKARFDAWVDEILAKRLAKERAKMPAAGADV
jgi:hypothetical protein